MDPEIFWAINHNLPLTGACEQLATRLEQLPPREIVAYKERFDLLMSEAYNHELWNAAYWLEGGGCGDDAFTDFRRGLISRGQKVFEESLQDPDSMVHLKPHKEKDGGIVCLEDFGYVASEVFKVKTGQNLNDYLSDSLFSITPSGEKWDLHDEEKCSHYIPKIWAKYLETKG